MLFEPSGALRCDYGAYCYVLGLTEREELYRSILTDEDLRRELEVRQSRLQVPPMEPPAVRETAAIIADDPSAARGRRSVSTRHSASISSLRGKKRSVVGDAVKGIPAPVALPPSLTRFVMRHPKFCLNQRDMRPLALAMPHCAALVAVELVGCGLSQESYLLLVESIYRCRRVTIVTVDFNCVVHPGFYVDPTVPTEVEDKHASFSLAETTPRSPETPALDTTMVALDVPLPSIIFTSAAARAAGASQLSPEDSQLSCNSPPRGVSHYPTHEQPSTRLITPSKVTFAPSAYRGLGSVPSALETQLREERERKGKSDSKKQAQWQQQQEQLAQMDREYRVWVPRGWSAVLLTGVKQLSLRGNGITDVMAAQMASLLLRHPRSELVSLNLWGNGITDTGAAALARVLQQNRALQALDLGRNAIGDAGMLAVVDAFRMREVSAEGLAAYRRRHLTRRDAGAKEQQLAATAPPAYPSYQELYAAWYQTRFPVAEEKREAKKTAQTKAKRAADHILIRPSTPFDRDCVRMEGCVRVPGNTVLRCVNLGDNTAITVAGATEACRILALQEPSTDEEMATLQNSAETPPELYCTSIQLSTFIILHGKDPALLEVQQGVNKVLYTRQLLLPQPPIEEEAPQEEVKRKSPRKK